MSRLNASVVVGLCAAAALAGLAIGRLAAPPQSAPAPEELGDALRAAIGEGDVFERSRRTVNLLEHLDPTNLLDVVAVYDELFPVVGRWEVRPFVAAWARFDPGDALDHVLAWPSGIQRQVAVEAALEGWARRDPTTAQLALEGAIAGHPRLREPLESGLVAGWVHSQQGGLDRYLAEQPRPFRNPAIGVAIRELMRGGGPDATLRWADSILANAVYDQDFKQSIFRPATRAVTRRQPERGAAWAMAHAGNEYAEGALNIIAEQWGKQDGRSAMEWLRNEAPGNARNRAVRAAFLEWLKSDRVGAETWLTSDSLTDFHDPALLAYARDLDETAPEKAVGWCERILDAERQLRCFGAVATEWYRQDAVEAEAWLQQSPLDDEARRKVQMRAKRPRRAEGARRPRGVRNRAAP